MMILLIISWQEATSLFQSSWPPWTQSWFQSLVGEHFLILLFSLLGQQQWLLGNEIETKYIYSIYLFTCRINPHPTRCRKIVKSQRAPIPDMQNILQIYHSHTSDHDLWPSQCLGSLTSCTTTASSSASPFFSEFWKQLALLGSMLQSIPLSGRNYHPNWSAQFS